MAPRSPRLPGSSRSTGSPRSAGSPERSDESKRERILDAALQICQRSGVGSARMDDVAALARVSKGTLYRFFESKEDLFLATIIDSYERGLRIVDGRLEEHGDPRQRLDRLLQGLTEVLEANSARMNVHYQAWGVIANDPRFQERLFGFLREFHEKRGETIVAILREGQGAGVFREDVDVGAVVDGIMALLSGFLHRSTFDSSRASPAALRACFEALVRSAVVGATRTHRLPAAGAGDG